MNHVKSGIGATEVDFLEVGTHVGIDSRGEYDPSRKVSYEDVMLTGHLSTELYEELSVGWVRIHFGVKPTHFVPARRTADGCCR